MKTINADDLVKILEGRIDLVDHKEMFNQKDGKLQFGSYADLEKEREIYKKVIEDIVKEMPAYNGWIATTERKPETPPQLRGREYLVTINGAAESTILQYTHNGEWVDEFGNRYNVTAWQEKPAIYQKE